MGVVLDQGLGGVADRGGVADGRDLVAERLERGGGRACLVGCARTVHHCDRDLGRLRERLARDRVGGRRHAQERLDGLEVGSVVRELDIAVVIALVDVGVGVRCHDRQRVLRGRLGVHRVVVEDQVGHIRSRQARVNRQVRCHCCDELGVGDGVREALSRDLGGEDPDELVVPSDSSEVGLCLLGPVRGVRAIGVVRLVLKVPGPDHSERLGSIQVIAPDVVLLKVRVGVVDTLGEIHVDPAEGIDHACEGVEVEFDKVLDRDTEVLLDSVDQLAWPLGEGCVDLVRPGRSCVRDEEVTRDRQDRDCVGGGVEVEHHHHVGVHAGDALRAQAVDGVLRLECASVG